MKTNIDLPVKIRIATPCHARWDDMAGDDRVRFCSICSKNVYHLSNMTRADATALIEGNNGNLCARMYQRADGTLLTADCPVGVRGYWRRAKMLVGAGVAALTLAFASINALGRSSSSGSQACNRARASANDALWKVKGWLGMKPRPVLMGAICPITVSPPPNPTNVFQGKIAVPPQPGQK